MRTSTTVLAFLLAAAASCAPGRSGDPPRPAGAAADADPNARWRIDERMLVTLPTGRSFLAEVARGDEEKARGLMFRPSLGKDEAMLFVYEAPQPLSIWMRNVRFPIDVLFLDVGPSPEKLVVAHATEAVPPCEADPCPTYPSPVDARYFLELPPYTISSDGLRRGDVLTLDRAP